MKGISKRQLEVFVRVVQLGSVTEAARVLGMSQPSVSKSLGVLEKHMGFSLFERSNARMQPTLPARQVFEEASQLLQGMARFDRLLEHVRHYSAGQLRVCATPALAINALPRAARYFRERFPDDGLVVDMVLNDHVEEAVALRQYDLGFFVQPGIDAGQESENEVVASGRMVCVLPRGHVLAHQHSVCWDDLTARELVYITTDQQIITIMEQAIPGFRERPVSALESNRYTMAINLVRQGLGITLVDEFALAGTDLEGLAIVPFEPFLPMTIRAVIGERRVAHQQTRTFVEAIRALCFPLVGQRDGE